MNYFCSRYQLEDKKKATTVHTYERITFYCFWNKLPLHHVISSNYWSFHNHMGLPCHSEKIANVRVQFHVMPILAQLQAAAKEVIPVLSATPTYKTAQSNAWEGIGIRRQGQLRSGRSRTTSSSGGSPHWDQIIMPISTLNQGHLKDFK